MCLIKRNHWLDAQMDWASETLHEGLQWRSWRWGCCTANQGLFLTPTAVSMSQGPGSKQETETTQDCESGKSNIKDHYLGDDLSRDKGTLKNAMGTDLESRDTAINLRQATRGGTDFREPHPLARNGTHACSPVLGGFGCLVPKGWLFGPGFIVKCILNQNVRLTLKHYGLLVMSYHPRHEEGPLHLLGWPILTPDVKFNL